MEMEGGSERAALGGRGGCWWKLSEEGFAGLFEFEPEGAATMVAVGRMETLWRWIEGLGRSREEG